MLKRISLLLALSIILSMGSVYAKSSGIVVEDNFSASQFDGTKWGDIANATIKEGRAVIGNISGDASMGTVNKTFSDFTLEFDIIQTLGEGCWWLKFDNNGGFKPSVQFMANGINYMVDDSSNAHKHEPMSGRNPNAYIKPNVEYTLKFEVSGTTANLLLKEKGATEFLNGGTIPDFKAQNGGIEIFTNAGAIISIDNVKLIPTGTIFATASSDINGQINVSLKPEVIINFSEPVSQDTLNVQNIIAYCGLSRADYSILPLDATRCKVIFNSPLPTNANVSIKVTPNVIALSGNVFEPLDIKFTTTNLILEFSDDFSNGINTQHWTGLANTTVADGVCKIGNGVDMSSIATAGRYSDFVMEFDFKKTTGTMFLKYRIGEGNLLFNIYDGGTLYHTPSKADEYMMGENSRNVFELNTNYRVKLMAIGEKAYLYTKKDGTTDFIHYGTVPNIPNRAGGIEFLAFNTIAQIDNFALYSAKGTNVSAVSSKDNTSIDLKFDTVPYYFNESKMTITSDNGKQNYTIEKLTDTNYKLNIALEAGKTYTVTLNNLYDNYGRDIKMPNNIIVIDANSLNVNVKNDLI